MIEMQFYHKIEGVFERATDGSKKLIPNQYRNKTVEYLKDNEWIFTEKIDGTNIILYWDGYKISIYGRTPNAQLPQGIVNWFMNFNTDETEQIFEQKFGATPVTIYGEGYGAKIQKCGGLYRNDNSVIVFDVMINNNFQPREAVEDICMALNLDIVPIMLYGTIDDAIKYIKTKPNSTIGTAPMEGVVGRPLYEMRDRCNNRIIVKIKVRDFCE